MPCWVTPAVAATFWGVDVGRVMADVAAGRIATEDVGGVLFVDVLPFGELYRPVAPPPPRPAPRRRSFAWDIPGVRPEVVTAAERDALAAMGDATTPSCTLVNTSAGTKAGSEPQIDLLESVHDDGEPPPLPDGPDEGPAATPPPVEEPPQWDSIRARVGRTRRPPPRARGIE